jgi:glycolate oxidase FAD binding subunit
LISRSAQRKIAPKVVGELSEVLAQCDRTGEKVAIRGGNTLRGMGVPPRADVVIETAKLASLLSHERADLTAAVQAGMTIGALSDALASCGQFVPLDAPLRRTATVGGTLAAGWLGPRRHIYGRGRDYVIGTHVVLADGTIAKAGGMVVKNVTGYDMSKLYVGSFGTLGVLTQANFKTLPMLAAARAFVARLPIATRTRAIERVQTLQTVPSAAWVVRGFQRDVDGDDGDDGRIIVFVEGSDAMLERTTRELRSSLGKAGVPETRIVDAGARDVFERTLDAYVGTVARRSITYRVLGDAGELDGRLDGMEALAQRFELQADCLGDVMNGDAILRVHDRDDRTFSSKIEMFDDALHDLEPRAIVIAGDAPMRPVLRVWGAPPAALAQMRAIKARFDPNNTLNPGFFVGGI